MTTLELIKRCKEGEQEFRVQQKAYEFRLDDLSKINWLIVGGGTIFPLIGGATLLTSSNNENLKIGAGILSILGACFTALHKAFDCEVYQAECLRLTNASRTLADAYKNALLDESSLPENLKKLEERREQLINSTKSRPGTRYMKRAIRELEGK